MQQFSAKAFYLMSRLLERVRLDHQYARNPGHPSFSGSALDVPLRDDSAEGLQRFMEEIDKHCQEIGLKLASKQVQFIRERAEKRTLTNRQAAQEIEQLDKLIQWEMGDSLFLHVPTDDADYYRKSWDGWEQIIERFPDTTRDVEEMNKCFALSRYTASMFHALHVAEWGAIALGDYIGVTDPKKGWGPTEKKLRDLVKSGHSKLPTNLVGKFEFLEQMNREIDSMMLAWRHKVDHAANHLAIVPNVEFSSDIAEHIIGAVRVFIGRLAEGIPI